MNEVLVAVIWAVFFLIVIVMFKGKINDLFDKIGRKGKIKYKNLDIDFNGTNDLTSQVEQSNSKHSELKTAFQNTIITNDEKFIRSKLIEANLTPDDAINVLVNHLANTRLNIAMLWVDKTIYIEQIECLAYMNTQFLPRPQSEIFSFYKKWLERTGGNSYPFEQFLNFLLSHNLIGESVNGYTILPQGKEYLSFLIRMGRPIPNGETSSGHTETVGAGK